MEITNFDAFECETSILGKITQTLSRRTPARSTKPFQLVYCDIAGPVEPTSREG